MLRVRATINGNEGGLGLSTFYFNGAGSATAAQALEAAARVRAYFASLQPRMATVTTVQVQSQVDVLTAETGKLTTSFAVAAQALVTGTGGASQLPGATQGLLRLNTGVVIAGRRVEGKSFVPNPVPGDNTASGTPSTTYQTGIATAGALLNTLITTALSSVTWHRPTGGIGGSIVLNTSFTCSPKWSVLRSRRD
jgi:hypothetical protein